MPVPFPGGSSGFKQVVGHQGFVATLSSVGNHVMLNFSPPTLTSVSIDSDTAISSGANEIAKTGDTVTLSFTASDTIQTPTVAFTVGGVPTTGSLTYANPSGNNWTAAFTLESGDTEGAVAFTIDFSDTAGYAGTQVTSTTDGTSVALAVVPGVPSGVSAIPSDVSAVISWTAPASDGGSPITEYTVTSDPGGVTATTASTSVTVTGLTQNTAYTFTVTATNAAGTSASSEASPSVTTKLTNIWDAPSTSGWSLAALVAGMLVVMVIALRRISDGRPAPS